ncbi:hypothetical protein CEQ90_20205 [Lewinellaceae bacterium SD302]|nr:hypothetical protein CEQ90_20205 [Lewinellaceae bacterium SD302]
MKFKFNLLLLVSMLFISCNTSDDEYFSNIPDGICDVNTEINPPIGFELNTLGGIDFNGSVRQFQIVNESIAYALLTNNRGGYIELFKSVDGGQTWIDLEVDIDMKPINMIFRDELFGIVTIRDFSNCTGSNCSRNSIYLETIDGGLSWQEKVVNNLNGTLYHPSFDSNGNLYSMLRTEKKSTMIKSINNGVDWEILFESEDLDFSLETFSYRLFDDRLYASGKDSTILIIDSNGSLINRFQSNVGSIWDLDVIDSSNIIVAGRKLLKTSDGGVSWNIISDEISRIIGFDSPDIGLAILRKSTCPSDVYQVNDVIAATLNGGFEWIESNMTTTNLRLNYSNSQSITSGEWFIMINNILFKIERR